MPRAAGVVPVAMPVAAAAPLPVAPTAAVHAVPPPGALRITLDAALRALRMNPAAAAAARAGPHYPPPPRAAVPPWGKWREMSGSDTLCVCTHRRRRCALGKMAGNAG